MDFLRKIFDGVARFFENLHAGIIFPKKGNGNISTLFFRGAFIGMLVVIAIIAIISGYYFQTGIPTFLMAIGLLVLSLILFYIFRYLFGLIKQYLDRTPIYVFSALAGAIAVAVVLHEFRFRWPDSVYYISLSIAFITQWMVFGSLVVLYSGAVTTKLKWLFTGLVLVGLSADIYGIFWLKNAGKNPYPIEIEVPNLALLSQNGISNPGLTGTFKFRFFTYGSGTDLRRTEYRESVLYKTTPVNAKIIIPEWKDKKAKWRKRYWGFSSEEFPINGRAWIPEKEGKLPVILIVHGNHTMEDYSDPGYGYLGELLASKGYFTVSVDENFINGTWSGDFRGKEMPARAWLLLKHLEVLRSWSRDKDHDLFGKLDLDNVILIGHSRGGEAVAIAANYNQLEYFPDNANVKFQFGFGIRGIVSIAPTDKRYFRRIELQNINYLTLQGTYDADESSFFGLRQYQRIVFEDSTSYLKAGVYIHNANHGQFNIGWGRYDSGPPFSWLLNVKPMITGEEQRAIAKTYIAAFTETVFEDEKIYSPLFKSAYHARDWLPETIYLNTVSFSGDVILANFEEDIDLTTGTLYINNIRGVNLNIWREDKLKYRDSDFQGNNAVVLGWDSSRDSLGISSYSIVLDSLVFRTDSSTLIFNIGRGDPKQFKKPDKDTLDDKQKSKNKSEDTLLVNFSIELVDNEGEIHTIELQDLKELSPRLKIQYSKLKGVSKSWGDEWEPALETYSVPLYLFPGVEQGSRITKIRFVFDKIEKGVIYLDDIGFSKIINN